MPARPEPPLRPRALAEAERLLEAVWGYRVRLRRGDDLTRSRRAVVVRCTVDADRAGAPATVVLKQAGGAGEAWNAHDPDVFGPAHRCFNEWTALEFLDGRWAPRLHAGSDRLGFVVMEDLGRAESVADRLLGTDATAARAALLAWAEALGRLNAEAIGEAARFEALRAARPAAGPGRGSVLAARLRQAHAALPELLAAVGASVPPGVRTELAAAVESMFTPGPFTAFSANDICPDNNLLTPDGVRFVDFEAADTHHALLDGACLVFTFPTCWCVGGMPAGLVAEMEHEYRSALVGGCPAAADDAAYARGMRAALAAWLTFTLGDLLRRTRQADFLMGTLPVSTGRQRLVARLEGFAGRHGELGGSEALSAWALGVAGALREVWAGSDLRMPVLPAFGGGRPAVGTGARPV